LQRGDTNRSLSSIKNGTPPPVVVLALTTQAVFREKQSLLQAAVVARQHQGNASSVGPKLTLRVLPVEWMSRRLQLKDAPEPFFEATL
jgi:hypothetical protein